MFSIKSAVVAAALTSTMVLSSIAPVQAQRFSVNVDQRDRVVREYCDRNSRLNDCREYRRGGWGKNDYDRFYGRHRVGLDQLAFGLFGLTFAGIVGAAIANDIDNDRWDRRDRRDRRGSRYDREWERHVAACEAAYRSYDEASDTFQPYGGVPRRACTL